MDTIMDLLSNSLVLLILFTVIVLVLSVVLVVWFKGFSEEEKEEIKQKMIEAGLPLLREKGIIHMSITKLTEAAGIGKSTFYNFYETKEDFVQEMLQSAFWPVPSGGVEESP